MSDDDLIYSTGYWWQVEHDDTPDDPPDPYEDDRTQSGNSKLRDGLGDHYGTTKEVADGEADSRNAGETGQALSDIDGFSAEDVPQWDGEE